MNNKACQTIDIKPKDIESVKATLQQSIIQVVSEPFEMKAKPSNVLNCQLSLPYCVAVAIINRETEFIYP